MTHRTRSLIVTALIVGLCASSGMLLRAYAQDVPGEPAALPSVAIPTVESAHPYKNNEAAFWTISNNSGQPAARIHFSRIELEGGVDRIEIRDAADTLIQEITASAPQGLWSDVVPGASIRVTLKTDGSGQFWGFAVDQLEPVAYTTIGYSPHPYPNGSSAEKTFINNTPSPAGTRVRFDRVELEDGVDYLVIKGLDDTPYQWITGSHPGGLTSKAVPGAAVKVQLVSDNSGQAWGYNVAEVQNAPAETPDAPPLRAVALAESDHPYGHNLATVWTVTNPDVAAVSTKLHFSRVELERNYDFVEVLDAQDTVIQTLTGTYEDLWSDYVPGRIVKLRLRSNPCCSAGWGFRVDALANSVGAPGLAQSDHPHGHNLEKVWTMTNPDTTAASSKVFFSRVDLERGYDFVEVLDAQDTVIQTLTGTYEDLWSDYVPGRVVKLRLRSNPCCSAGWGFRVNNLVSSVANPGLAQSDHPYGHSLTKVWTITNPNVNASASRVHFSRVELERNYDFVEVLDAQDTVIQTLTGTYADLWSDYVPGRIVKLRLRSNPCCSAGWGFRVDAIEPSSSQNPPAAGVNALLIQINAPGEVYLGGKKLFTVSYAGEYRIPLAGVAGVGGAAAEPSVAAPGSYEIKIEYVTGYTQVIQATIGANGSINIVYLPLTRR